MKYWKKLVSGFNEVIKSLNFKKLSLLPKLVIIAVDIQQNNLKGGTDEKVLSIINQCRIKNIPIVYSCTRKELGFAMYGRKSWISPKIGTIAINNV